LPARRALAARLRLAILVSFVAAAGHARLLAQTPTPTPATARGRITGRVVDGASGQPLAHAQVAVDQTAGAETDLDGRYTVNGVAVGLHSVQARRIGFQQKRYDSVTVMSGQATVVNFTINAASVALESMVIKEVRTDASASEASLLAIQQRAAAASDGISAEQIKRTPDSDASAAATRVSGISVVDSRFVIVRGLSERYSTTLVNGVDVASPEPAKKIVPLDIFPTSLLESIVVTKSATPDKPGDFSGGAVEVKTKEFPDNDVRQFSLSQSFNSQATFDRLPFLSRTFWDYLAIDHGRRAHPAVDLATLTDSFVVERFAEGLRRDWGPRAARIPPNLGLGFTFGGQQPSENVALGYVLSLTYSSNSERSHDRFFQFYSTPNDRTPNRAYVYQDYRSVVDWGGVANVSARFGSSSKLSLKNFYSRNAEDLYSTSEGFATDKNGDVRAYQIAYVERDLLQSQLGGEHLLGALGSSRLEWKATVSRSGRDEPDNRQVVYTRDGTGQYSLTPNSDAWFRSLTDKQLAGQVDWILPTRLLWHDFTFKAGGLQKAKRRSFDGLVASFNLSQNVPQDLRYMPPELLFTPENIGGFVQLGFPGQRAVPYDADEDLTAYFGMVDTDILPRVRLVAGARQENWSLDLFDGGKKRFAPGDTAHVPTVRRNDDLLWSANATVSITDRMNVRLAAFTSVARPDTRELSLDEYTDIVGNCATIGNPLLRRTKVLNADARWEWYPNAGEVVSLSGFFKDFDSPIIRTVSGGAGCRYGYVNALTARNAGLEVDARKNLSFLPGGLSKLSVGANFTLVQSRVTIDPIYGKYDPNLALEGQSPYLANGSLSYLGDTFTGTVLYNVFGDRVVRYGVIAGDAQGPSLDEQARGTLDAKFQRTLGRGIMLSLAGKNLTNAKARITQKLQAKRVSTGVSEPGVTLSVGVSYAR
jgi:hypothetical protein